MNGTYVGFVVPKALFDAMQKRMERAGFAGPTEYMRNLIRRDIQEGLA